MVLSYPIYMTIQNESKIYIKISLDKLYKEKI